MTSDRVPIAPPASRSRRIAFGIAAATLGIAMFIALANGLFVLDGAAVGIGALVLPAISLLLIVNLGVVGGVLAVRRPESAIGWLLLAAGLASAVGFGGGNYAALDDILGPGRRPFVAPLPGSRR